MQSPALSQNYFELFGLKPVFEIDHKFLQAEQHRLQAKFHPDRYVGSNDQEKRISVQLASRVNQAYSTLRDPVKRARYLLEISGVNLPDESATTADTAFLMAQIELREEIDACRSSESALLDCERIAQRLRQQIDQLCQEFTTSFAAQAYEMALETSRKMQFIQRIQDQLAELQFELEEI